jgi:hypothetical protein
MVNDMLRYSKESCDECGFGFGDTTLKVSSSTGRKMDRPYSVCSNA